VLAADAAGDLRVRTLAQHEHVVVAAGGHERGTEPVREREHADEREHDEGDAERRRQRRRRPLDEAADVVDDGDLHATYLSASTTLSFEDCHAGTAPLATAISSAIPAAIATIDGVTLSPGTKPPMSKSARLKTRNAPPRPSTNPSVATTSASESTIRITSPSVKPSVFSTAMSEKRSRADIAKIGRAHV